MTGPQDELPTTVVPQQTVEQPAVTTAPATRRARMWNRKLPARIGRARTSTVVIGCLFVLLGGLNFVLPEQDPYVTVPTSDGGTVRVRQSQYTPAPTSPSTTAPAPTSSVPSGSTTSTTTGTRTPSTTTGREEEQEETTVPPSTTSRATTTAPAPSSTRATTSRAPSTTAAPEEDEETPVETAEPTG